MSKSLIHKIVLLLLTLSLYPIRNVAQEANRAMFIHCKDSGLHTVFFSDVDSIVYSHVDLDSVTCDDYVTQEIWTPDTVVRISLDDIQDISFQTPETEYKNGVIVLNEEYQSWIVACDSLTLFFRPNVPTDLLPHIGDKLVTTDMNDVFPLGFIGQVTSINYTYEVIQVECNEILLSDVFDRYYCVVEGVCERSPEGIIRLKKAKGNYSEPLAPIKFSDKIEFNTGWKSSEYCELGGGISTEYSFEIQPTLRFVYINEYGEQFVSINFDFDETFTTACDLFGYFKVEKEVPVVNVPIPVEAVPLTKFYIKAGPRFEFGGNLALSFQRFDKFKTGYFFTKGTNPNVKYRNGFKKVTRTDEDQSVTMAVGNLSLYGGLFLEVGYGLLIEDWGKVYARFDAGMELKLEADLGKSVDDAAFSTTLYDRANDLVTLGLDFCYGPSIGISMEVGNVHAGISKSAMTHIPVFKKGLFPRFENTRFIIDNNRDGQLYFEAGGDMLTSVPVGFKVLDENNQQVACEWFDNEVIGPMFLPYKMPYQIPKVNKKYTAYPVFKFLNKYEILASPSAEISIDIAPVADGSDILSSRSAQLKGHVEGKKGYLDESVVFGFIYGTNSQLESSDTKRVIAQCDPNYNFTATANDLSGGKTYYYKAFIYVNGEYCYSDETLEFTSPLSVEISNVTTTAAQYRPTGHPQHFTYKDKLYEFKYNVATTVTLSNDEGVENWGYCYKGPENDSVISRISLKGAPYTYEDKRFPYYRNGSPTGHTARLYPFVKYTDDDKYYYGEPIDYPLIYPDTSKIELTGCSTPEVVTRQNVEYNGAIYDYCSTFIIDYTATGAYWISVGAEKFGNGWNTWEQGLFPSEQAKAMDGSNRLTLNFYYNARVLYGDYYIRLKGTDDTHEAGSCVSNDYVRLIHNGQVFTGCELKR